MAVTTAIWSSYEDKGGLSCPEMPYTYTFITTTALSGFTLLLIPFIRIGKQGSVSYEWFDSSLAGDEVKSKSSSAHGDSSNRPSKRWSLVDTVSQASPSSSFMADHRHQQHHHQPQHHPNRPHWNCNNSSCFCNRSERTTTTSYWSKSADGPRGATMTDSSGCCGASTRTNSNPNPNPRTPNNSRNGSGIVWVVCEDCGTKRKRPNATAAADAGGSVGDPARYFNDPACGGGGGGGGTASDYSSNSNRSPKTTAAVPAATPVSSTHPYPGRRRLPLVNREAMTYQMITQGIQP